MDGIDGEILGILMANARVSFSDLGREVGLSANAVAARVRRLENDGVILGYTTVVAADVERPVSSLEVFIDVRLDASTDFETFSRRLAGFREVADTVHMTGPFDALVHAFVLDTGALDTFLGRLKRECGAGQTQTRVALRSGNQALRSGSQAPRSGVRTARR
jgi:Lrp/AsnC family leucine-responsive transcriptional regulator